MSVTGWVLCGLCLAVLIHTVIDYIHAWRLDQAEEKLHSVKIDVACQRGNIEAMRRDFNDNLKIDKSLYNRVKSSEASIDIAFQRLNEIQALLSSARQTEADAPEAVSLDPAEGAKAEQA